MREDDTIRSISFGAIAPHYDVLMRDIPYSLWRQYLLNLVVLNGKQDLLREDARILDVACGTGTLSLLFAKDGYHVTGVDLSEPMVNEARRKAEEAGLPVEFLVQDVAELDVGSATYDFCVSVFDSLNYVTDPQRLQQAFARVYNALKPGGLFIFDINTPLALRKHMFDQEDVAPGEPVRYMWRSQFDESTRLCTVSMEFWVNTSEGEKHVVETHVQRAYENREIETYLRASGFDRVRVYHAYTFDPPKPSSDRVFFVAHRVAA